VKQLAIKTCYLQNIQSKRFIAYVCLRLTVMLLSDKNNQAYFENNILCLVQTDITIKMKFHHVENKTIYCLIISKQITTLL
jgi:hypothetical protein